MSNELVPGGGNPWDGDLIPVDFKNLPANWSAEQKIKYINHVNRMQANPMGLVAANVPMTCKGDRCPFAERCELMRDGVAPIGKACPIEGIILSKTFNGFCDSLDVDMNDAADINLVRELAQIEVELSRVAQILSKEGMIQNKCVGLVDGEPVFQEDEHVMLRTEDRLRKRKEKVLQLLNSTRKDKAANRIDINVNTPETFLNQILSNAKNANKSQFIDVDPEEL